MNRILALLLLLILFLSFGCTIQKRQFRSGWHISMKKAYSSDQKKEKSNEKIQSSIKISQRDKITLKNPARGPENSDNPSKYNTDRKTALERQIKSKNNNHHFKEQSGHSLYQHKAITFQNQQSKNRTKKREKEEPEPKNDDSEGQWFPGFLGGFFGALIGLIAFVPLFYVVCFFFLVDGKVSDLTFEKKDTDSPFVSSFKKTYHIVFRIGVLIMIIFLVINAAIIIIFVGYVILHIIGLILGSLIALLILILFIRRWRNLLDALMFYE